MSFKEFSTFNDFWTAISQQIKNNNRPSYHPCCRVWVSRNNKTCRASHASVQLWRDVLLSVKSEDTDHKTLLHVHMLEHQWGLPILLNAPCSARVSPAALNQALQKSETQPKPPSPAKPFQLHTQPVIPNSPFSTPALHLEPLRDSEAQTLGADPRPNFPLDFEISNTRYAPNLTSASNTASSSYKKASSTSKKTCKRESKRFMWPNCLQKNARSSRTRKSR